MPFTPALPQRSRDAGLSVDVPLSLRVRARKFALDHGTTLQEVVVAALDGYLANQEGTQRKG